ncbi:MAG: response regulator transcription factor [Fibrobacter sp.]|nr:response regulator transcription factor [Fibrobacter sp.]
MSLSVMIVEDCPIFLGMIRRVLGETDGLKVESYSDGCLAWERICETPPDLLITDNKMPKMSGVELAGLVSAKYPQVEIIIMTACPEMLKDDCKFTVIGKTGRDFHLKLLKIVNEYKSTKYIGI